MHRATGFDTRARRIEVYTVQPFYMNVLGASKYAQSNCFDCMLRAAKYAQSNRFWHTCSAHRSMHGATVLYERAPCIEVCTEQPFRHMINQGRHRASCSDIYTWSLRRKIVYIGMLSASTSASEASISVYLLDASKYAQSNRLDIYMLGASKYAQSNRFWTKSHCTHEYAHSQYMLFQACSRRSFLA